MPARRTRRAAVFHLHCESYAARPREFQVHESDVRAARRRHPELAKRLRVTVGFDGDVFDEAMKTADFLVSSSPPRAGLAERAPRLRWIATTGAGIDHLLPLDWLPEGVTLTNNSGPHAAKAQDSGALCLLMLNARIPMFASAQRAHAWRHAFSTPIAGKTAVIVGFGDVGRAVGRAARRLGVRVIAVTRSGRPSPLAERTVRAARLARVIGQADFVVVAAPLTPETRGLVDGAMLDRMKDGAGLVNIGRAPIVDYAAVCDRLRSGKLSGAILDVFEREPLPADSPLWDVPNLCVLPHVTCDDPRYIAMLLDRWFANFARFLAGRPLANVVDPVRGY